MIDHVTIRVADLGLAHDFYERALRLLDPPQTGEADRGFEWNDFSIVAATTERAPTRRLHIGFGARDRDQVDDWWQAMRDAGDPEGQARVRTTRRRITEHSSPIPRATASRPSTTITSGPTAARSTICGSASETSSARAASTRRWRRSWATRSRGTQNESPSAETPRHPSRSSPAIPRRICTSPSFTTSTAGRPPPRLVTWGQQSRRSEPRCPSAKRSSQGCDFAATLGRAAERGF